jgi:ParB/RepB/Spo0J family partition protein
MSKVAKLVIGSDDMVFFNYTSVERVVEGKRIRDIDEKTVNELVESFKQFGVLEPITVTQNNGIYSVIAGHHRWIAFLRLLDQAGENKSDYCMPAIRVFINKDDEEALQITENLHRNDLTTAERKEMGARYLILLNEQSKQGEQAKQNEQAKNSSREQKWFSQWHEKVGIPRPTAQRMWQEFADATGLTITPSKATVKQQQEFAQWHLAQSEQRKADEAAKEKQSKDDAAASALDKTRKTFFKQIEMLVEWTMIARQGGMLPSEIRKAIRDVVANVPD